MRTSTKAISGLALFLLMLTSALANAQSPNQKTANPPASPAAAKPTPKSTGNMQNAQSNPMYKDHKMEATNPLYERNSAAPGNGGSSAGQGGSNQNVQGQKTQSTTAAESHEVVQYKDGDDATTRYRPGNNKTTKLVVPAGTPSSPGKTVEYKDGEDGVSHTRPSNPK